MADINNKAEARQKLAALFKQDAGKPGTLSGAGVASIAGGLLGARDGHIGALRGETSITIQTRQAQILLTGREASEGKPRIMGLMQFSTYLSQIAVAARQDDPWADWMLVQVEERLEQAEGKLKEQQANLDRVLGANPMMDIQVSESVKPLKVSIGFASSHAYWVARVILQFDSVVRAVLTARHHALLDQQMSSLLMDDAARLIRRIFETTVRYRVTGLTRADLKAGNARVAEAEQKMGCVPADILEGARRAKFAPALPASQTEQASAPAEEKPTPAAADSDEAGATYDEAQAAGV